jgi:hypothetical protein
MPTFCDFYTLSHVPSWIFFWMPLYMHKWFFNFSLPSSREKLIWSFYLLFWKHLFILIIVPKAASNFCSGFPLLLLVDFFECTFIVGFQNNFQCHMSSEFIVSFQTNFQAIHGTTFRDKGCWQKARSPEQSLKRVTGRNFTISQWFHRSNSNFNMVIQLSFTKRQPKIVKL